VTRQAQKVKLSGALGLRDADIIRGQLLDALTGIRAVKVDAGQLTAIDMSVLQVLIAAQKMARTRNIKFQITAAASGPLRDAMTRAGLLAGSAAFDIQWQERSAARSCRRCWPAVSRIPGTS
jgi:anti-anti-sigma regulatory factor